MVSIIILIQDRYDYVKRCIDLILAHTTTPYELVLIQQGPVSISLDAYLHGLNMYRNYKHGEAAIKKYQVFYNEINTGVTPGRNQGIGESTGDYFLFFDDDGYVSEDLSYIPENEQHLDWLARMLRYYWERDGVGIVSQTGSYINPSQPGMFWECTKRGGDCDVGQGYCFMFSRDVFNKIGPLDPTFGKFWHEESEYSLRAKDAGFRVIDTDYIGVTHYGTNSGDDGTYGKKIDYMFNKWKHRFNDILVPRERWNV